MPSIAKSWQNARKECKKANADLITIDDAAEQSRLEAFLTAKGIHTRAHWIGLNDIQSEGRCMTYSNDQNRKSVLHQDISNRSQEKYALENVSFQTCKIKTNCQ